MKTMKNLQQYIPDEPQLGASVIYLRCEEGKDWYQSQSEFSAETIKLAVNSSGVICALSDDVSRLWPVGLTVVEVDKTNIPEGVSASGEWLFDGTNISRDEVTVAKKEKHRLLNEANSHISSLQDRSDVGVATKSETSQLTDWKKYRIELNNVDTDKAPDITWPEIPA